MTKTLLVDANNLLKIGIHGVKDFYNKGEHVGGIWHFLNTLRKFLEENNYNKIVVCWDSDTGSTPRKKIYPKYKLNRKQRDNDIDIENSFKYQKNRIKEYLEEMFVRQLEVENCEADDLIAYYCKISPNEEKTIFSSDRDLTQLISETVRIYSPQHKRYYSNGDKIKMYEVEIPHYNVKTYKILTGDSSDNIDGIFYLGEKTFIKFFPEILENKVNYTDILTKAQELLNEEKRNSTLQNLLTGRTKDGIFGDEFFTVNEKLVDLETPLITEEGKEMVMLYYSESLDPDGRGYKNLIKMMMNDGLFKFLPKGDDAWVNFLKPFLKLTRKEKTNFRNKKVENERTRTNKG
jgi:5'-3' exonuclease